MPEVDRLRYLPIYLKTAEDLADLTPQLKTQLRATTMIGFDLDGTIVNNGSEFPQLGILSLKDTTLLTTIVSGAGALGVMGKISKSMTNLQVSSISDLFSGPVICNEGAIILRNSTRLASVTVRDVISETIISPPAIRSAFERIYQLPSTSINFMGFYPSVSQNKFDPFQYVFFAKDDEKAKELKNRYGSKSTSVDKVETLLEAMIDLGASKIVIQPSTTVATINDIVANLKKTCLSAEVNEGYINIVDGTINKGLVLKRVGQLIGQPQVKPNNTIFFGNDFNDLTALLDSKISIIVDSNPILSHNLVNRLTNLDRRGLTLIIDPLLVNNILILISQLHHG